MVDNFIDNNISDNDNEKASKSMVINKEWIRIILCILETIFSFIFIIMMLLILFGLIPGLFNPSLGLMCVIGAGILQSDLIVRAIDGTGFSW